MQEATSATTKGNRNGVYITLAESGMPVPGSIRKNEGRSIRAAASKLDTSTEDLVNKGYRVAPGRLYVDKSTPVELHQP